MPFPADGPTTRDQVKAWAKINDADDDALIDDVVEAVNALVRGLPVAQGSNTDPAPADWPATIVLGSTMLGARLHRRRNTVGGVEVSGDFGIAYVRRSDPDIAHLLEMGEYARPGVG